MGNFVKGIKIVLFLATEVIAQLILILFSEQFSVNFPNLNIIIGMLIAIVFMFYWDNTRAIRLSRLEHDVDTNERNSQQKLKELSSEIRTTKEEVVILKKRLDSTERK